MATNRHFTERMLSLIRTIAPYIFPQGSSSARWLHRLTPVLLFISFMLLLFLCLACLHPADAFSDIYLIRTPASGESSNATTSVVHAGYFRLCTVSTAINGTTTCNSISRGPAGVAQTFSRHVVRPYLLIVTTVLTAVAFLIWILSIFIMQLGLWALIATVASTFFNLLSATWQEVAVHAALRLTSTATKGTRASGLVWAALCMLTISVAIELYDYFSGVFRPYLAPIDPNMATFAEGSPYASSSFTSSVKQYPTV